MARSTRRKGVSALQRNEWPDAVHSRTPTLPVCCHRRWPFARRLACSHMIDIMMNKRQRTILMTHAAAALQQCTCALWLPTPCTHAQCLRCPQRHAAAARVPVLRRPVAAERKKNLPGRVRKLWPFSPLG